jgi:aminoglycoside 3-N-acetyltransferase
MPSPAVPSDFPATQSSIAADLAALGVQPGMVLVVHASFKSLGEVIGGPVAVILALEEVLGPAGTLVMPTFTADITEPANWVNPPVPTSWWEPIRAHLPAYDPSLTPTYHMGWIAETFRKQAGVLRSANPDTSFAAWGRHAHTVTANHAVAPLFGEQSPLARVYDLDGHVLLLGVGHDRNSSLHLGECRARIPHRTIHTGVPMLVDGVRRWVAYDDIDWDDTGFADLGADFARATGLQRTGKVAQATALLVPQRALVDYAVDWLERNRSRASA